MSASKEGREGTTVVDKLAREAANIRLGLPSSAVQDEERERDEQACRYLAELSSPARTAWEACGRPTEIIKPNTPFEISTTRLQALLTIELQGMLAWNVPGLHCRLQDALEAEMAGGMPKGVTTLQAVRAAKAHAESLAHRLDRIERAIHHYQYREAVAAPGAERFEGWPNRPKGPNGPGGGGRPHSGTQRE